MKYDLCVTNDQIRFAVEREEEEEERKKQQQMILTKANFDHIQTEKCCPTVNSQA